MGTKSIARTQLGLWGAALALAGCVADVGDGEILSAAEELGSISRECVEVRLRAADASDDERRALIAAHPDCFEIAAPDAADAAAHCADVRALAAGFRGDPALEARVRAAFPECFRAPPPGVPDECARIRERYAAATTDEERAEIRRAYHECVGAEPPPAPAPERCGELRRQAGEAAAAGDDDRARELADAYLRCLEEAAPAPEPEACADERERLSEARRLGDAEATRRALEAYEACIGAAPPAAPDPAPGACEGVICRDGAACFETARGAVCAPADCRVDGGVLVCPGTDVGSVCDTLAAPVCGTDGVTYANRCAASAAGVRVAHEGPC